MRKSINDKIKDVETRIVEIDDLMKSSQTPTDYYVAGMSCKTRCGEHLYLNKASGRLELLSQKSIAQEFSEIRAKLEEKHVENYRKKYSKMITYSALKKSSAPRVFDYKRVRIEDYPKSNKSILKDRSVLYRVLGIPVLIAYFVSRFLSEMRKQFRKIKHSDKKSIPNFSNQSRNKEVVERFIDNGNSNHSVAENTQNGVLAQELLILVKELMELRKAKQKQNTAMSIIIAVVATVLGSLITAALLPKLQAAIPGIFY